MTDVCSDKALSLVFRINFSTPSDMTKLPMSRANEPSIQWFKNNRFGDFLDPRAQARPWYMISTVGPDTWSHQSLWGNNKHNPVDLSHFDPWLTEIDSPQSCMWDTGEGWVLVESRVAWGILAVRHTHLSVKVLSCVKVLRRVAAWRHSALTRACSRPNREAHVCRGRQTRWLETDG